MAVVRVVLVLLALGCTAYASLTGAWDPCKKDDPNLQECLMKSVDKFIPVLKKGIPKVNIPPMDPLSLSVIDMSSPNLKMVYKDAKMSKLFTDYKIVGVLGEPDKYTFRVELQIPEVVSDGQYELDGKLMVMPVKGNGEFLITYKNVTFALTFVGKAKEKAGKPYFELQEVKVVFQPSELVVKIENLFNGNKELSDNFHKFVNENWREIFADFKEQLWAALGAMLKQGFAQLFETVPYNEIYIF